MRTKIGPAVLSAMFFVFVCGCQAAPDSTAVTSKNDGAFEAALEAAADVQTEAAEDDPVSIQEPVTYTDSFTNTDGDITYQVELDIPAVTTSMPVLRVTPKTITAECAQHVAEVLFGDADIYEYSEIRSKAELEDMILSLRQLLADQDAMEEKYGAMKDEMAEQIEAEITKYEDEYAAAPETAETSLCSWEFHPRSWYVAADDRGVPVAIDQTMIGDNKSQYIVATSERDGFPYIYAVCNREEDDYRMHTIACAINEAIDSSQIPTEAEIEAAQDEAEDLLTAMDLGQWVIDSCVTESTPSMPGSDAYSIVVTACPVYDGVKVSHQQQMAFLNTADAYASNYYYEEMVFTFSGGHLVSFKYISPMDVTEVVNENVAILSFEEAMEICKGRLQMNTLTAEPYALGRFYQMVMFYPSADMNVDVYQAELGLARTRIKDNATDFYLLPAYTFRASYSLYDKNGQLLLDSSDLEPRTLYASELLVVNAVDGSVINTELGY